MADTSPSLPLVGLDAYSLTGPSGHEICENDIFTMLRAVKQLGADGLQASVPDDPEEIDAAFDLAADLNLYLEPYIQLPIHWRNNAEEIERRTRRVQLICNAAAPTMSMRCIAPWERVSVSRILHDGRRLSRIQPIP